MGSFCGNTLKSFTNYCTNHVNISGSLLAPEPPARQAGPGADGQGADGGQRQAELRRDHRVQDHGHLHPGMVTIKF